MSEILIFDTEFKLKQLENCRNKYENHNFIHKEFAKRLSKQFEGLITKEFENCLNLYSRDSYLTDLLKKSGSVKNIEEADISFALADIRPQKGKNIRHYIDNEIIDIKPESYDLIVSNLAINWVNDLPGHFVQIKNLLKKGGFFTANLIGGGSLKELRQCLATAETELTGNLSPRISPFLEVKDGAALLQRTGFNEPVSTSEEITIKYGRLIDLLKDIKNSGEGNSLINRNKTTPPKELFKKAEDIYRKDFTDENGALNATIEVINISGWKF